MTKGPTRLIDQDPGFARLVAASENEEPSSDQLDKALSLATDAAATSRWSLGWRGGLTARLAVGVAAIGIAVLGIASMRDERASRSDAIQTGLVPAPAESVVIAPPRREPAVTIVSVHDLAPAPPPKVPARAPAPGGSTRTSSPEGPIAGSARGSFSDELALVSTARAALEAGDAPACLRAVERYDERFRSGIFAQEIEVLRIEAIAASGEKARARTLAERFLATNGRSPYADRVRSLVERTHN
ncbi:MAG: hypothetical protein K0S65_6098 [Labilithrix sp.]|nr:hypothetical protein [Labilithrix sp.]